MDESAASMDNTLTVEKFKKMIDEYFPVLYYGLDENIERGVLYFCKKTDLNPEFIVVHPLDFEEVKKTITARRLVHIKDEPKDKILERIKRG